MGNLTSTQYEDADDVYSAILDHHRCKYSGKCPTIISKSEKEGHIRMICTLQHRHNMSLSQKKNDDNESKKTVVCAGYISASIDKKTNMYSIKKLTDHTCEVDVQSVRGSRSTLYTNKFLARSAGASVLENPSISARHAAKLSAEHLNMSKDSIKYMSAYRIKEHLGKLRWGTPYQYYGTAVHRLEMMKQHDPDCRIFVKFFADEVSLASVNMRKIWENTQHKLSHSISSGR